MIHFAPQNLRLVLLGGEALRPEANPLWRDLLSLGGDAPHVAIIPVALSGLPLSQRERRTQIVCDRFTELGVPTTIWTADDRAAPLLNGTCVFYLPGGDQRMVASGLSQSTLWETLAANQSGTCLLVASGGAAVAFGKQIFAPQKPYPAALDNLTFDLLPGLGLLLDAIVLPYFSWLQDQIIDRIQALAPATTLVGIDDQAALLSHPDGWQAAGLGTVSIFKPDRPTAIFDPGHVIPPDLLSPYPLEKP